MKNFKELEEELNQINETLNGKIKLPEIVAQTLQARADEINAELSTVKSERVADAIEQLLRDQTAKIATITNGITSDIVVVVEYDHETGTITAKSSRKRIIGKSGISRASNFIVTLTLNDGTILTDFNTYASALDKLKSLNIVPSDYGVGNSANRALQSLVKNSVIADMSVAEKSENETDGKK